MTEIKEHSEKKPQEHPAFHYTVDDEPQTTAEHELTPQEILTQAGLNSATYYLVLIKGNEQVSYKDKYDEKIHMHQNMKFISVFTGETPVSELYNESNGIH